MSGLLGSEFEEAIMIDKTSIVDDYGSPKTTYVEGAHFMAAFPFDSSLQARIAAQEGVTDRYRILTRRNINLQYHDVIKRASDGKIFRITSDGDDMRTPKGAGLDLRQVEAERWEIPVDE